MPHNTYDLNFNKKKKKNWLTLRFHMGTARSHTFPLYDESVVGTGLVPTNLTLANLDATFSRRPSPVPTHPTPSSPGAPHAIYVVPPSDSNFSRQPATLSPFHPSGSVIALRPALFPPVTFFLYYVFVL